MLDFMSKLSGLSFCSETIRDDVIISVGTRVAIKRLPRDPIGKLTMDSAIRSVPS